MRLSNMTSTPTRLHTAGSTALDATAPPCAVCDRPADALRELADDIVRAVHARVPTLWSLPRRGGAAEHRTSFLLDLLGGLLGGAAGHAGDHPRQEPTRSLATVQAGLDRMVAAGTADLATVLDLLHQVEFLMDRWLWDARWSTPVTDLSAGTRHIAAVGHELRTALVVSRCRQAAGRADLLLGQVLVVDEEAARGAADRLGLTLDLDTTWYVLAGQPHQTPWLHDVPVAGPVPGPQHGCGWLVAADPARPFLAGLHDRLAEAGEALVVVGPLAAADLRAGIAQATQVAHLARAAGLHGVVRRTDVLVEAMVVEVPQALTGLAGLLHRLDGQGPDLPATLERFYANGLNKTRTAAMLGIRRSTLEYRLARVHQLTGLHPESTRGVQVLTTALVAAKLLETRGQDHAGQVTRQTAAARPGRIGSPQSSIPLGRGSLVS
jgi:hypothetical protein